MSAKFIASMPTYDEKLRTKFPDRQWPPYGSNDTFIPRLGKMYKDLTAEEEAEEKRLHFIDRMSDRRSWPVFLHWLVSNRDEWRTNKNFTDTWNGFYEEFKAATDSGVTPEIFEECAQRPQSCATVRSKLPRASDAGRLFTTLLRVTVSEERAKQCGAIIHDVVAGVMLLRNSTHLAERMLKEFSIPEYQNLLAPEWIRPRGMRSPANTSYWLSGWPDQKEDCFDG